MRKKLLYGSLLLGLAGSYGAAAQTPAKDAVKARITTAMCDCLTKKTAAAPPATQTAAQLKNSLLACLGTGMAKEMTALRQAYGQNNFDKNTMRQLGEELGITLVGSCPDSQAYFAAMAGESTAATPAATTGQTIGQLGALGGPGLPQLEITLDKGEKQYFAWVGYFATADAMLRRLPDLQGRTVRVAWREVELLQPDTHQYQKVREITDLELQ